MTLTDYEGYIHIHYTRNSIYLRASFEKKNSKSTFINLKKKFVNLFIGHTKVYQPPLQILSTMVLQNKYNLETLFMKEEFPLQSCQLPCYPPLDSMSQLTTYSG